MRTSGVYLPSQTQLGENGRGIPLPLWKMHLYLGAMLFHAEGKILSYYSRAFLTTQCLKCKFWPHELIVVRGPL